MYTPFWYNQPSILYERPYLFEIFPVKEFDNIRKLNAIVRFTIYYSIFVYIYNRDTNMFAVPVITALVTYLLWKNNSSLQKDETLTQLKNDVPVIPEPHNVDVKFLRKIIPL